MGRSWCEWILRIAKWMRMHEVHRIKPDKSMAGIGIAAN
jgi:hypothetical protein